jgi:hypothetical protein
MDYIKKLCLTNLTDIPMIFFFFIFLFIQTFLHFFIFFNVKNLKFNIIPSAFFI